MINCELKKLLLALSRAIQGSDKELKRSCFEDVRTYALTNKVAQGIMDTLLITCAKDVHIRHLGMRLIAIVSVEAIALYREALITSADCGTLLYLVRATMIPLSKSEIVTLGHRIKHFSPKMSPEDMQKLLTIASDTFVGISEDAVNVISLDHIRFTQQLKYGH